MDSINPVYQFTTGEQPEVDTLFKGILEGNRILLSKAITLIESSHPDHRNAKFDLLQRCYALNKTSVRIGLTGVPGAGKSTLTEALGKLIIDQGNKLAVLAIDPSSSKTKGSILGDKTRMQELSVNPSAFIRPTASSGNLGGTSAYTREVITLCEAAGYNYILVETVGVGQSETMVSDLTDIFVLLAVPGTGDELQGIKRGIMEMADIIAINKSEGENAPKAKIAATQLKNALHLFPIADGDWIPQVMNISALEQTGIDELLNKIESYFHHQKTKGLFEEKRKLQKGIWIDRYIQELFHLHLMHTISEKELEKLKAEAIKKNISSLQAASDIIHRVLRG